MEHKSGLEPAGEIRFHEEAFVGWERLPAGVAKRQLRDLFLGVELPFCDEDEDLTELGESSYAFAPSPGDFMASQDNSGCVQGEYDLVEMEGHQAIILRVASAVVLFSPLDGTCAEWLSRRVGEGGFVTLAGVRVIRVFSLGELLDVSQVPRA